MPESDPLTIGLAHNEWATEQILNACANLTPEQFQQRFEIGPGSLHKTIAHMLSAMALWTQVLAGQQPGARLEDDGQLRSPQELLALLKKFSDAFHAEVRRLPFEGVVARTRDGRTIQFTRGVVVMQVTTHGMHHRAQCLNMLRQLGLKPLPPSSVAEWSWMADAKK
jgi:uncharacterized damage-inducible protein DinB